MFCIAIFLQQRVEDLWSAQSVENEESSTPADNLTKLRRKQRSVSKNCSTYISVEIPCFTLDNIKQYSVQAEE